MHERIERWKERWERCIGISRWRYRLEKGRPHSILLLLLLLLLCLFLVLGGLWLYETHQVAKFSEGMWWTFLHLSDPGYLGDDRGWRIRAFGTLLTIAGLLLFTAGLIAVINSMLISALKRLNEGGYDVVFRNHIVIVGWNSRIYMLLMELLDADDTSEIAILADLPKEEAEREIERRVFDHLDNETKGLDRIFFWRDRRRNVVYRRGNPLVFQDLRRVGVGRARDFILLGLEYDASEASDILVLRRFLAVTQARRECDGKGKKPFRVVVEIGQERFRAHTFLAADLDPRADAWIAHDEEMLEARGIRSYLPDPVISPSNQDLTLVNGDELLSRVLVQCVVQSNLSRIYEEILSFTGKEFYLFDMAEIPRQEEGRWKECFRKVARMPPARRPTALAAALRNGLVVGLFEQGERGSGRILFAPERWHEHLGSTPLVVLGEGQRHRDGHIEPIRLRPKPLPL
ncbi:MAG: hypothetical protein D6795_19410, partial [Deltaproteobacteria bacterium]